jgi:hypothetical protein
MGESKKQERRKMTMVVDERGEEGVVMRSIAG